VLVVVASWLFLWMNQKLSGLHSQESQNINKKIIITFEAVRQLFVSTIAFQVTSELSGAL
jgi:hypothetical protein